MEHKQEQTFGPIRSFLWPIHRHEMKKFIPMLCMLFLICCNYTILRNMKDSLVITAAGAEVIPFIKVWVLLPMAILVTILFTKLSNRLSQDKVFYLMISAFLAFYLLFAFFLYPNREMLQPTTSAAALEAMLPSGFKGLIAMYRNWTLTGFYVFSELWGTTILAVSFWGFANEVTTLTEARRFYSILGIGSNISTVVAAQTSIIFAGNGVYNPNIPFGTTPWEQTMMGLILLVLISGLLTIALFWWLNRTTLDDPHFKELHTSLRPAPKKSKQKLSLRESFAYLSNSKYLGYIAILVVSYNLVINLVEVVWKDQLRTLCPLPADYNAYINNLTIAQGLCSTVGALFMARIIAYLGWTKTALITPISMLVTSLGFFIFILFKEDLSTAVVAVTGTTPLAIAVFFGGAQNALSKAAKYSFFDTTKEMAFIPLEHESKLKGKAAIDGVGSRIGKSGGSLIHQGLLMVFTTLTASAPYVGLILMIVIAMWILATKSLGVQFAQLAQQQTAGTQEETWIKQEDAAPQAQSA